MKILEALKQINIEGKKAEVYLSCLETGGATAYLISKKTGIKRPTVYDLINQLMEEGLVYKSIKGRIKYFSPSDPEKLIRLIKEKEEAIKSIIPDLQKLYNSPKIKPTIKYFNGKEGIKEMYEDSLRALKPGGTILTYSGEGGLSVLPNYADEYIKKRILSGIRVRAIFKRTKETAKYIIENEKHLREAVVLSGEHFPINNEINIYANKTAIASYGKEMFGMIIESEEVANAQRAIFELAWRGAKEIEKETQI